MFDARNYFKKRNKDFESDYEKNLNRVQEIIVETQKNSHSKMNVFFFHVSEWIFMLAEMEKDFNEDYFKKHSFEELKEFNYRLFKELLPENYDNSYANPAYCSQKFGPEIGKLISFLYFEFRNFVSYATKHLIYKMNRAIVQFIQFYETYQKHGENYEELKNIVVYPVWAEMYDSLSLTFELKYNPEFAYYTDLIKNSDLSDLRYLFYLGSYISDIEIKTAQFVNKLSEEKIRKVMRLTAEAYVEGFVESGKDYKKRPNVNLISCIGMERMAKILIEELEKYGFTAMMSTLSSKNPNQQFDYDHRFDLALYLDEEYLTHYLIETEKAIEDNKSNIEKCSGTLYFDPFGEKPFAPINKPENMKLTDAQIELNKTMKNKYSMMFYKAYKRDEASFCIIGFPTPEIGDQFEEIFDKTIDINMLNHKEYLRIQQFLIDALDQGDHVIIKGQNSNQTDLKIQLPKLTDPSKQTNFCNCGATVNIPVGEVFNTPQLTGTHGRLHISETFLNNLFFKDLTLDFVDGCISEYSCKNFESEADNKKYIEENLIFPHKSLPIGEFAIGTNTLAYMVAKKYNILSLLPILIIEKMGPHFAIGDTCYSWEEDTPAFNPDGKEIISRDNERSILRKEDVSKAYTQIHVDITLPYEEIGSIYVVTEDQKTINLIINGRFVLEGTEPLNVPFDTL